MRITITIFLFFYLLAIDLKSQDKLTGEDFLDGIIRTCITDSTAFLNADTIILELGANVEHNLDCPNRPKISGKYAPWASGVSFLFGRKSVMLATNKELIDKNNDGIIEAFGHKPRQGKFKYFEKNNTIRITFKQYNWSKTFKVLYNKKEETLTLIVIK